jgi:DNA-binding MltR family transcriptional regulator
MGAYATLDSASDEARNLGRRKRPVRSGGNAKGMISMATPTYLKNFKAFLASSPGFFNDPEMLKEFYAGSDRAAVILQASLVEGILEAILTTKMRPDLPKDLKDRLFDGSGPLSSFAAKINVAYALELFGPVFLHDLNLIRELRNGFAHAQYPMTLSTLEIAEVCKHLRLVDDQKLSIIPLSYYENSPGRAVANDKTHPRTRFTVTCHTIAISLLQAQPKIAARVMHTLP